jgi:hypothetical protein
MPRMNLGLYGPTYYGGFSPFLNWYKTGWRLEIERTSGGNLSGYSIFSANYCDSDGELVNPASVGGSDVTVMIRLFFAPTTAEQIDAGCDYSGEQWVAEWDGSATASFGGGVASQASVGSNKQTMTMGTSPGNTFLALTLTNINDPPSNIRIYQARYATNVANGEKFNPDWLAEVRKFGTIRFMGWMPTNDEIITDFTQLADENYLTWCFGFTSLTGESGPKGSLHPSIICDLAIAADVPRIHVCVPIQATDAFITSFATYFRDRLASTGIVVAFELSNEVWNSQFTQYTYASNEGEPIWGSGDLSRQNKWYGKRSCEMLKIVSDVFANRSRWRGVFGTQTVSTGVTNAIITGIDYWRANILSPPNSLTIADLFNELSVAGYFGDFILGSQPSAITNANPGVATHTGHGYSTGQKLRFFATTGMTELNNVNATITVINANSYSLGINTTSYGTWTTASGANYAVPAAFFDLADESTAANISSPGTYPTKYTLFNQVFCQSLLTGSATSPGGVTYTTEYCITYLVNTIWPPQKTIATANGLELNQYEGGCHVVGNPYLTGAGGNAQYMEFLFNLGHSSEMAAVYAASYSGFFQVGGINPSKFVEGGASSQFGTWAGVRHWPLAANSDDDDADNPVWLAVLAANEDPDTDFGHRRGFSVIHGNARRHVRMIST